MNEKPKFAPTRCSRNSRSRIFRYSRDLNYRQPSYKMFVPMWFGHESKTKTVAFLIRERKRIKPNENQLLTLVLTQILSDRTFIKCFCLMMLLSWFELVQYVDFKTNIRATPLCDIYQHCPLSILIATHSA